MNSRPVRDFVIAGAALLAAVLATSGARAAECPTFPYVHWWGNMTHENVRASVKQQYGGDWRPVIQALQGELSKMLALKSQARPYQVPNTTRSLAGGQLDVYVDQTRLALSIVNCLKDQDAAASGALRTTQTGQAGAAATAR